MTKSEITCSTLIDQGWEHIRDSWKSGYRPAGLVEQMENRQGFELCRVYTSTTRRHRHAPSSQLTNVFRREIVL